MTNLYNKLWNPFEILVSQLTFPGAVAGIIIVAVLICLGLLTAKGRLWLVSGSIVMFLLTQTATLGGGTNLPAIITVTALNLRWVTMIPLCLAGTFFLLNGQGLKYSSFLILFPLFVYLMLCAFFSSGLPRYLLWIFMWTGVISCTVDITVQLSYKTIMKYWHRMAFILAGLSIFVAVVTPGKAFVGIRFNGMMTNPNTYGFLVFFLAPPIIWAIFEKKKKNPLNYGLLVYFVITLIMSGSRSAMLALVPLIIYVFLVYIKKPGLLVMLFLLTGLIIFLAGVIVDPVVLERLTSVKTSGRMEMWKFLWPYITESPFGQGIGWIDRSMDMGPHNSYLWMATEAGYMWAFIFFFCMAFIVFRGGFRRKYYDTEETAHLKIILQLFILGFLLMGFFESWLIGIGGCHLPCFLFAIGLKEGLISWQKRRYAYQQMVEYDDIDLGDEACFQPIFLAKKAYYMKLLGYSDR